MIDNIKSYDYRLSILEDKIKDLELENNSEDNSNYLNNFSKNLINYNVLTKKKFFIAEFDGVKNKSLYLNTQVHLSLQKSQNILFNLYANDKVFYSTKKTILIGDQETSILAEYKSIKKEHVKLYVEVEPLEGVLAVIKNISIYMFGLKTLESKIEYNILELPEKYLISTNSNNSIYYSYVSKTTSNLNIKDFKFLKSAISHAFAFNKETNELLLFWIDIGKRLFCLNLNNYNKIFIDDNVTNVSATFGKEILLVSYIKNNNCYYIENCNFSQFINKKHINFFNNSIISSLPYFNTYTDKFYIILTDKKFSNYLIESLDENFSNAENISANYLITVSTYGENI